MNLTEFKELIQRKIEHNKERLKKNLMYSDRYYTVVELQTLERVQKWLSEVK